MLVTKLHDRVPGSRRHVYVEIPLLNPYVVGGHALVAADFGLKVLDSFVPYCANSPLYMPYWDQANGKLLICVIGAPGAQAGAIDLSAIKVYGMAIGYR